ncbi:replication initiator protein [Amycolatopsis rhizosphaerae]|uniref:Replication initiator protein n=1 Tax=Amycolatopsis rhizosphaerae TaxID=2053003 RepID=A0A558CH56_9PSEU|nr:replication initiator [Amycolatopsis rhizosphaerae]TVT48105.1 replication initiator protein [Amycolatopsis rhizosphaerae]
MTSSTGTGTRAERMRQPLSTEVMQAVAEKYGVCVRPFTMEVGDPDTGELRYVPVPCGSTVESVCAPCAKKAKALRMTQCREGWHLTEEPDFTSMPPTEEQKELTAFRADLVQAYREAVQQGEEGQADELREEIRGVDEELRQLGVRGRPPSPEPPLRKPAKRSTKRRQDAPNLPRRKVAKITVGREYAGKFRPSMFVTLTCDTYGRVREDGTPVDMATYDYRRAARDAVHFSALVDRWWQNLRRVVGWDVQYFATVEPQKRAAPHLHTALRGSIPHEVIRQVTEATYHQVWWPNHDQLIYCGDKTPVWDMRSLSFVDPDTREPLTGWDEAVEAVEEPAHVVTFGRQVHSKGILGGTDEAGRHIGYLTKYLTKSTSEVVEASSERQRDHHDRLHAELAVTPCSPRCPVWLLYGIQPRGVTSRTTPGHCKGRAHRRATLGLPGRRVLVSRKWSGKTLADHKADRKAFVRDMLAAVGIVKPEQDTSRLIWRKLNPGDRDAPPRAHLLMHAISERIAWRAEYDRALLAAGPPGSETSAIREAA